MSYAVVRMVKLKSHDLKGIQFHNQRERESKTNLDIDKSKSAFNYDLINSKNIDYNKQVKEIIESQKEGTRKIRKDAVLVNEFLVTSDKPFFDNLSPVREKEFFKESAEFFKNRYGEQNIVFATVHIDEKTPHMHIGVVPMRDGKLQGKNVFNRQELLAIQEEFPKHMMGKGFDLERGELGSKAEHIEIQRLKVMTVNEEVQKLEYTRKTLENDVQGLLKNLEDVKKVDEIQTEKVGLFDRRSVKIDSEDLKGIKALAKVSEVLKTENKQLKSEVEKLAEENKGLKIRSRIIAEENGKLMAENKKLTKVIETYKTVINNLQKTIEVVKSNSQKHLGIGLERMQSYVGEARLHVWFNKLGREVFQKVNLEKFIPEDERKGADKYIEKVNARQPEEEKQQRSRSYDGDNDKGMER